MSLKRENIFVILSIIGIIIVNLLFIISSVNTVFILIINAVFILLEIIFKFHQHKITPYLFFLSSPILLINFFTVDDFLLRLFLLLIFSYIFYFIIEGFSLEIVFNPNHKVVYFVSVLFLFFLSFLFYYKGIYLSGDEPHYIIVAQSLAEDGDFNLNNNYENQTYLRFHPSKLEPHAYKHNNKLLSFHLPGVSFLMAPFYFIYKIIGYSIPAQLFFRLSISIINSFFALLLYLIFSYFVKGEKKNFLFIFMITIIPVSIHAIHIYPEIPAAILILSAIYFGILKNNDLLFGLFISLIPWFHIKYLPVMIIIFIFYLYNKFKQKDVKFLFKFLVFPFISGVSFSIFMLTQYGFLNPMKIFPAGDYMKIPLIQMIETFFAFFLDQRDGFLFYSPIYFLFFYAVFKVKTIGKKHKIFFISILLIYMFFHSITTIRGAYAPVARPMVFVVWIPILFVLVYLSENDNKGFLFKTMIAITVFLNLLILNYPSFIYQPVISSTTIRSSALFRFLGRENFNLYKFFPSFLKTDNSHYYANYFWIGLVLLIILNSKFGFIKVSSDKKKNIFPSLIIFIIFFYLFLFYPHVYKGYYWSSGNIGFFVNSKNFIKLKNNRFRLKTNEKYLLLFDSKRLVKKKIKLRLFSYDNNKFDLKINSGLKKIISKKTDGNLKLKINILKLKRIKISHNYYPYMSIKIDTNKNINAIYSIID